MSKLLVSNRRASSFLMASKKHGFSMESKLLHKNRCTEIHNELDDNGFLRDKIELVDTDLFPELGMEVCHSAHTAINSTVNKKFNRGLSDFNNFPYFSVRLFEPGQTGTTIHRNHIEVGPWVVGITLSGSAPFNIYGQDQLADGDIVPLSGEDDPIPTHSMNADTGSAWPL